MLDLTQEEKRALQIVVLKTEVNKESYGAVHQFNWKKTGLSRAYYKEVLVDERSMPTARAAAAFRWLCDNSKWYKIAHEKQKELIAAKASLNISSYDLFVVHIV